MNLSQVILRRLLASKNTFPCRGSLFKTLSTKDTSSSSSSSSSSESDEESAKKPPNSDAITRLNSLLQQMVSDDAAREAIKLAQPQNKRAQGREEKKASTKESIEKQVVKAVKDVADSLGGNTKQTESELLTKLLNPVDESNLTLSDILKGMKIEREQKSPQSKAEQVRDVLQRFSGQRRGPFRPPSDRTPKHRRASFVDDSKPQEVDLFGSEPLGIFTNAADLKESPQLPTWQRLHERELKLAVTHPPANYFQQMILWTEQGKLWQFPINNEFGLEEESKVYFSDHVFLEEHLEPWCPPKGPLRHFMELVCVGLSKNSFLTVAAKKEHIDWYRKYFEAKKELLQQVGALPGGEPKVASIDKV